MPAQVVVNADDLGVSRGATLGIIEAHRSGIVSSASLAVTTDHYPHAIAEAVRPCPELGIGLHFTLTSGRPVAPVAQVPLLAGPDGFFRWRFTSLWRALSSPDGSDLLAQVGIELEAQLGRLAQDGVRPDHINGERHVHLIPGIFGLVVAAAERHGIPFVRAGRDAGYGVLRGAHLPGLLARGGLVKSWLLGDLSRRGRQLLDGSVRTPDTVASYLYTGRLDLVTPALLRPGRMEGILEIMVHPGLPEESRGASLGNQELEQYLLSPDRRRELDACISARALSVAPQPTTYGRLAAQRRIAA